MADEPGSPLTGVRRRRGMHGASGEALAPCGRRIPASQMESLYLKYFQPLVRDAVWNRPISKEDAEDVVQDAFKLASLRLRTGGNPRAWLKRVVEQKAATLVATRRRRARLLELWSSATNPEPIAEGEEADHEV